MTNKIKYCNFCEEKDGDIEWGRLFNLKRD